MRLRHIEIFHALMVGGTVSAAAKLLNLTQPAVSQYLKSLELQLGYPLFERIRGRLIPTQEAQALHTEVNNLHSQLDIVRQMAINLKKPEGKPLRIMAAPALALEIVPRALRSFLSEYPDARISIKSAYSKQAIESLVRQEADFGVVYQSASHPLIDLQTIGWGELVCVAPPGVLARQTSVSVADLQGMTVFVPEYQHPLGKLLLNLYREQGLVVAEHIQIQQLHVALNLVAAGLGVAIVDSLTVLSVDKRRVRVLSLQPAIRFNISAASLSTVARPLLADRLTEHLRKTMDASCAGHAA